MTPTGQLTEFKLPNAGSAPEGITVGPDGNLWFTEHGTTNIGRITTAGKIEEFPVGKDGSPKNIVAADGSLWFTDLGTNKLGRITLAGQVTERSVGGGYRQLEGLAAGTDGSVWLAETHANTVARVLASSFGG
jgi:virginiamycin B lyase